jgi:L-threonylcarbamoyladenylate synthase
MTSPITTNLNKAVGALSSGHLCAIPTETVYGLAADATNESAIKRVFEAKGRPTDHPLIVHVATFEDAKDWILDFPDWAIKLAKKYWPGPLTLVGNRTAMATDLVTGGQDNVAVRVPAHSIAQQLLSELKNQGVKGLVAPSANRFGHVSPTTAKHVESDLADYLIKHGDLILDGGQSSVGLESTIVLITGSNPVILRPGAITKEDIEITTGLKVSETATTKPRVSGSLDSHYSPKAEVILVAESNIPDEVGAGFIGLSVNQIPTGLTVLLSAPDLESYATGLYEALRLGDELGLTKIYAVLPDGDGLAQAIGDRLTRAAH